MYFNDVVRQYFLAQAKFENPPFILTKGPVIVRGDRHNMYLSNVMFLFCTRRNLRLCALIKVKHNIVFIVSLFNRLSWSCFLIPHKKAILWGPRIRSTWHELMCSNNMILQYYILLFRFLSKKTISISMFFASYI